MPGRATLAASLALAGGVAAAVGSFLPWVEFSAGPFTEQATGVSGWEGKATLVASLVVIAASARALTRGPEASSRLRTSAAAGGLVAVGVAAYTAITARDQLMDAAEADLPRSVVEDALRTGLLELSLTVGLFVVIVGGLLGVLAAMLQPGPWVGAPAGEGRGMTGWSAAPQGPAPAPQGADPAPSPSDPGPDRAS